MSDRSTWAIYKQTGSGLSWELSADTIYRPNENTSFGKMGNISTIRLANGSNGYVIPETKFIDDPVVLTFLNIPEDDGLKQLLESYVESGEKLKIVDHLGNNMIGIFSMVQRVWLIDEAGDYYDLQATFIRMAE